MRSADVVVAHAGVGTAITALSAGKCPVLLPRRKRHGEHVDDHQVDIARALGSRGLAVVADADEVSMDDLALAASWGAHDVGMPALSLDPAAQA
jgi:UDP-N-acetylglucosamine transferase subunit ALG13